MLVQHKTKLLEEEGKEKHKKEEDIYVCTICIRTPVQLFGDDHVIIICQQNLVWRERQNYVLYKKNLAEHKCMGLADLLDTETQFSNFYHFEGSDSLFGTILFSSWPKIRFESGSLCSPTAIITEGFWVLGVLFVVVVKALPAYCVTVNLYQHAVLL